MKAVRVVWTSLVAVALAFVGRAQAEDCESVLAKYMVGRALLAANYVAAAEKAAILDH